MVVRWRGKALPGAKVTKIGSGGGDGLWLDMQHGAVSDSCHAARGWHHWESACAAYHSPTNPPWQPRERYPLPAFTQSSSCSSLRLGPTFTPSIMALLSSAAAAA